MGTTMPSIPLPDFLAFAKTQEGQVIPTLAGKSKFTVRVVGDGLEFTPLSTRKPRLHKRSYVERVLRHFHNTGSWANTDYKFTVNATYQLTLIGRYLDSKTRA
jgi:hypothetical protein